MLWTYIDPTAKGEYVQTMLSRSNGRPLTVRLEDKVYRDYLPVLKMALGEMDRIQALHLEPLPDYKYYSSITELSRTPAPLLHSLTLVGPLPYEWRLQEPPMPPLVLHAVLPSLRKVELSHLDFRLARTFIRPSITKFILRYSGKSNDLTIVHVFECIREMPLLEVLHLDESFKAGDTSRRCGSLSLPHLRSLHICGSGTACVWFLDHLNHSYLDDISISCTTGDSFSEDSQLSALLSNMTSHLAAPESQLLPLAFQLMFQPGGDCTFSGFASIPSIDALLMIPRYLDKAPFDKTPFMSLSLPPILTYAALRMLDSHLSLSSVQVLSLGRTEYGLSPRISDIIRCVQAMTAVHTLTVVGWNASEVASILTPITPSSTGQVNLPYLETIHAMNLHFGQKEIWLKPFIRSLEVRRDVLNKAITLRLKQINLTDQSIDALRRVTGELEVREVRYQDATSWDVELNDLWDSDESL